MHDLYERSRISMPVLVGLLFLIRWAAAAAFRADSRVRALFWFAIAASLVRWLTTLVPARRRDALAGMRAQFLFFAAGVGLTSLAIGAISVLSWPLLDPVHIAILATIVGGIVSGSVMSLGISFTVYMLYMVPMVSSLIVMTVTDQRPPWGAEILTTAFSLFAITVMSMGLDQSRTYRRGIELSLQLRASNEKLEKLSIVASETDNAVMIMDGGGNVEWVNLAFTRMYGLTLPELLEKRGSNLRQISFNPGIGALLEKCQSEKRSVSYQNTDQAKDGRSFWTQTTLTPILDEQGAVTRLVTIDSDITKIKEAEAAAERSRELADKANQSKSEFLSRMSHEIRTPMNGVIGFTDMLLDTELSEEQMDFARTISRSGEALISLLNDILDFSKIEAGELTFDAIDFDPEMMAFDICDLIAPRVGTKPVEILCRIGDRVPALVHGDPGRVRQVIVNLMGNASKFTEQGEIELSLDVIEEQDDRLKLLAKVRDTGIGVPADKLGQIFEPFKQADGSTTRKYGGTGLGLSICRQISRLMGGDVWAESSPGRGSTFHFSCWLGAARKPLARSPQNEIMEGRRALIVDDNPTNLEILANTLKRVHMNVVRASDPRTVLATLAGSFERGLPIDIAIIDIQMPGISGFDLAKEIRRQKPPIGTVPLMAFSSSTVSRSRKFQEAGFNGFLPKPIRRSKLIKMVARLLGAESAVAEENKPRELVTQHSINEESKHAIHILLAEDNPINQKLACFILQKAGYTITMAVNGKEALEKLSQDPGGFDMILMDVQMPVMDGREATRQIRGRGFQDIPIIAMTAEAMKGDREKCLAAGMNDYIAKPLKRNVVYEMVKKYCLDA